MNVLYLCPNFPPNYQRFPVSLARAGAAVAGIGWESWERLPEELRGSLREYARVEDMSNYEHLHKAAAYLISRLGRLDRVAAQEEHWLGAAAALRRDFNVEGERPEDLRRLQSKALMKDGFARAGVKTARWASAGDAAALKRLLREAGLPLIAKPDIGVGAHGARKLATSAELEAFLAERPPEADFIVEEFLPGAVETFDGLADRAGKPVFHTSHRYHEGILEVVGRDDHTHYWSMRELPADLESAGLRSVEAFGLRERFFHFEFIRVPGRGLYGMEVNARPPGGLTTDMFNYANDIDVYREWASILTGGSFEASWSRPYHAVFAGRKSGKAYLRSHEEILAGEGALLAAHSPIDSVFRQALGDYAYLLRSPRLEEALAAVARIQELRP